MLALCPPILLRLEDALTVMERTFNAEALETALETVTRRLAGSVCMHVLAPASTDARVMRSATAIAQAGLAVCIVDVVHDPARPRAEHREGLHLKHIVMSKRLVRYYKPVRLVPWLLFKMTRMLLGVFELLRTPADIYHAHEITALPACYIAARLRRKPLIYDAHELPLVDPHITRWPLLRALSTHLLRGMMSYCSGIITVSSPLAHELQRRYGGRAAVVVRNIPEYQEPIVSDRLRRYLGLGADTRIALYQGYLLADRQLNRLIRAARFVDPGVVIVMMGEGAAQPDLESLIAQEQVGDRVRIIPPVPHAELLAWTAAADVGLIVYGQDHSPNVQMCLPNKLFEYLMAGIPVLASPLEAVADIIKAYDVGSVVTSLEPQELGRALSDMLADGRSLARMRRNARTASRRDLRWDIESQRLIRLYQDMPGVRVYGA